MTDRPYDRQFQGEMRVRGKPGLAAAARNSGDRAARASTEETDGSDAGRRRQTGDEEE